MNSIQSWGFSAAVGNSRVESNQGRTSLAGLMELSSVIDQTVSSGSLEPDSPTQLTVFDLVRDSFSGFRTLNDTGLGEIIDFEFGEALWRAVWEGDNFFHLIANPTYHDSPHRSRPWPELLDMTRRVVNALVVLGVDINAANSLGQPPIAVAISANMTPFYRTLNVEQVYEDGVNVTEDIHWAEGHAIIAFLEAGASLHIDGGDGRLLWEWMTLDPGLNGFPETSNDVFNAIVRSMPFFPGTYFDMPLVHRIIWEKPETVRELLTRLKSADSRHPLDIDAINDVGDTALLSVVAHSTRHSVDFRYGQGIEKLKLLPDSAHGR
jgi:hypothetical protein